MKLVPLYGADMVPLLDEAVNLNLPVNTFSEAVIPLRAAGKIGCMDTLRDWLYIIHCTYIVYVYIVYYAIHGHIEGLWEQKRDLFKPFRWQRNEQKTL